MDRLRALAGVGTGVVVTVVLSVVATWLPTWTLVVPTVLSAVVGGATASVLSRSNETWGFALGSVAGGLGVALISVLVGLVGLVVLLGMTPADGSEPNVATAARTVVSLSVSIGVVAGAVVGGVGGVGGCVARRRFGEE